MKKGLKEIIVRAITRGQEQGELDEDVLPPVILEYPREEQHGDYATNIAMAIASQTKKPPRAIAEIIVRCIEDDEGISWRKGLLRKIGYKLA